MNLVQLGTTASRANREKSVKNSIAQRLVQWDHEGNGQRLKVSFSANSEGFSANSAVKGCWSSCPTSPVHSTHRPLARFDSARSGTPCRSVHILPFQRGSFPQRKSAG